MADLSICPICLDAVKNGGRIDDPEKLSLWLEHPDVTLIEESSASMDSSGVVTFQYSARCFACGFSVNLEKEYPCLEQFV